MQKLDEFGPFETVITKELGIETAQLHLFDQNIEWHQNQRWLHWIALKQYGTNHIYLERILECTKDYTQLIRNLYRCIDDVSPRSAEFEKMYNDFVQDYFNSDKAVVFISHFECDYEDFTEMKDDYYENKIYGENQIFISEEICDEEKLKDFNTDYYHWQCSKGTLANTRITVVYADKFKRININNYTDFYNDESILYDSGLTFINNGQYANPQITIYKKDDNGKTVREKEKFDLNQYGKKEYENVNN